MHLLQARVIVICDEAFVICIPIFRLFLPAMLESDLPGTIGPHLLSYSSEPANAIP